MDTHAPASRSGSVYEPITACQVLLKLRYQAFSPCPWVDWSSVRIINVDFDEVRIGGES